MKQLETPAGDGSLIARIATGDASALAELYDRHATSAYSLACAMLGDTGEAEEAVADAFLQVWNTAPRFDGERATVAGWLMMIVRTRSLDRLRARRRRDVRVRRAIESEGDADGPAIPVSSPARSPAEETEHSLLRDRIARELGRLPVEQRQAIEMAYFRGLTHSEIAAELDTPLGTVKTRIRMGMQRLRAALEDLVSVE